MPNVRDGWCNKIPTPTSAAIPISTNWYDDQILDVVAYLNKAYYKFEDGPQQNSELDAESGKAVQATVVAKTDGD